MTTASTLFDSKSDIRTIRGLFTRIQSDWIYTAFQNSSDTELTKNLICELDKILDIPHEQRKDSIKILFAEYLENSDSNKTKSKAMIF